MQQSKQHIEKSLGANLSTKKGAKAILSTKLLSASQKELLLNANQSFVEYNAIQIAFLTFDIDPAYTNYVFTSQNGVHAFLKNQNNVIVTQKKVFCVGEKTKSLLEENGLKVIEMAQNSSKLGEIIAKKHKNESFLYFSGNLRRPELTAVLTKNNIQYKEVVAYNTTLNYKKFNRNFDAVLFFSPSAIKSYTKENTLNQSWLFCIGETTATEAKKHTNKIVIANKPTIENVLVQAIKMDYKY